MASMKRVKIAAIAVVLLVAAGVVFYLFLRFAANPQWHRRLYVFQAGYSEDLRLQPPDGYNGMWNNWDQEGRLVSTYAYKNGRRDGPYVTYDERGNAIAEGMYSSGEFDGIQKIRHGNGTRTEISYQNGRRNGVEKTWFASGQIAIEAPWSNGEQEGVVTFYYEDGKIQASIPFYAGKIEGMQKTWHEDGSLLGEENYRSHLKNGKSEFWRQDGSRDMVLNYRDDVMDGVQTWFHPTGEKAREIVLSQGIPNGSWMEWDEKGILVVDDAYDMGELKRKD